jgi:ATP-dependent protease HslVU (ClpYQ) ATPase subunit
VDLEEFTRKEIESKGIIVIDEIDKLVKSVIPSSINGVD